MSIEQMIFDRAKLNGWNDAAANLLVAQAKHETANFTSHVFDTDNNLFGYNYAGQSLASPGLAQPGGGNYAHYDNYQDSIDDVLGWFARREAEGAFIINSLTTPQAYAQALKDAGYYTGPLTAYLNGLARYLGNLTSTQFAGLGVIVLVALFFLIFVNRKR
jgi:flagellum-specific peptidoglycan hydrolase FlgJ